jgi:hypothetical protein
VDNKNNQNESPASCSPQMNSDKRPSKRRKKTDSPVNERASPINKTASPQVEPLSVDEVVTTTAATTTTTTTPGSTRSTRRNTNKEDLVLFEDVINKKPTKAHTPTISAAAASVTKKEDSPTTNHNEPFWNFSNGKPTRASSPPAKVKYPNTKMTFSDMNKRAKQIMDCISKWQPTTSSPAQLSHASLLLFESQYSRPRSLSTSSSSSSSCLSTASTVPLLLDDYTTTEGSSPSTPIPYLQQQQQTQKQPHQETSLDILERINHELTKFQRKFGTMYQEPKVNKSTAAA